MTVSSVRHAVSILIVAGAAVVSACSAERVVDRTVDGTLWVGKTAVKGTVGAGKVAARGIHSAVDGDE